MLALSRDIGFVANSLNPLVEDTLCVYACPHSGRYALCVCSPSVALASGLKVPRGILSWRYLPYCL
jgi:hypothetical protein